MPPSSGPPSMDGSGKQAVKSQVLKRSIVIAGHKTSISLEDAFWKGLKEIAGKRSLSLSDLVTAIDSGRQNSNLSSTIRLFVLDFYRDQVSHQQSERELCRQSL
jgi:predicted DNA-binding ribbon-helix-helix protein